MLFFFLPVPIGREGERRCNHDHQKQRLQILLNPQRHHRHCRRRLKMMKTKMKILLLVLHLRLTRRPYAIGLQQDHRTDSDAEMKTDWGVEACRLAEAEWRKAEASWSCLQYKTTIYVNSNSSM